MALVYLPWVKLWQTAITTISQDEGCPTQERQRIVFKIRWDGFWVANNDRYYLQTARSSQIFFFWNGGTVFLFTFITNFGISKKIWQGLNIWVLVTLVINTRAEGQSVETEMTQKSPFWDSWLFLSFWSIKSKWHITSFKGLKEMNSIVRRVNIIWWGESGVLSGSSL